MKTIAYLRVSTNEQDTNHQRLAILDHAHESGFSVDRFHGYRVSSRKTVKARGIDDLMGELERGDRLVVAELSRLGRSVGQIISIVDQLLNGGVAFHAIKERIILDGEHNLQSKVMITLFGLFAEIERDLISERTKEGLASAKAAGKILGRPKGSRSSKLDDRLDEIKRLLGIGVPKTTIAKTLGVSRSTLNHFVKTRVELTL